MYKIASPLSPLERLNWFLAALLPLLFTVNHLTHTIVVTAANPYVLAHFEGSKPFQLRVLTPLLLAILEKLGVDLSYGIQLIALGSALALGVAFRWYFSEFLPPAKARWVALLAWLPITLFFTHYWFYLYDVPSVLFLTLGLLLLQRQQWTQFGVLLLVASLNRESSLLLVLCYGATYWSLKDATFWRRFLIYGLIWMAVKVALALIFAHSPGPGIELHTGDNSVFLSHPAEWKAGFIASALVLLEMIGVALWKWRFLPRLLQASVVVGVAHLCLLGFVGLVFETRIYGELVPLLLPAALVGLANFQSAPTN